MKYRGLHIVRLMAACVMATVSVGVSGQDDFTRRYHEFRTQARGAYRSFMEQCHEDYAEALRQAWQAYEVRPEIRRPKDPVVVPPRPYEKKDGGGDAPSPVRIVADETVTPPDPAPVVLPVEPVREDDRATDLLDFDFFGTTLSVRMPGASVLESLDCTPVNVADRWTAVNGQLANTVRDCLELRARYGLCDWAYLLMLDKLSRAYCGGSGNGAVMMLASLFCQSGYSMRLASAADRIYMLYGCRHTIYDKSYFKVDGLNFYPYDCTEPRLRISGAAFYGETPLSLVISRPQRIGGSMSDVRRIRSAAYADMALSVQVNTGLIEFFDTYPSSEFGGDCMTRWAMYADTPVDPDLKDSVYAQLRPALKGLDGHAAVSKLLDLVQTGFEYEFDDKVWGRDRAFFAEETLYYPYCDCEDRSILFSRLVRDLVGLDVGLVYYPGHLAAAVRFGEDVAGDGVIISGERYVICDPTYIGAPVGMSMPDLDTSSVRTIRLKR